jgi:hypothetical protein
MNLPYVMLIIVLDNSNQHLIFQKLACCMTARDRAGDAEELADANAVLRIRRLEF